MVPGNCSAGKDRLVPGISLDTYVFRRFKLVDFECDVGYQPPSLWFSSPRSWRKKIDPLEAAVVPVESSVHPEHGRCDTLCCCWSVFADPFGDSGIWGMNFGTVKTFSNHAGNGGCIVVARLDDVLSAMRTNDTVPEGRVMLWLEEMAQIEAQTPGFLSKLGNLDYTGWPLVYKRKAFAEEREIRFVLQRGGAYLRGEPRMVAFGWNGLNGILLSDRDYLKYYRAICDKHLAAPRSLEFGCLCENGDSLKAVKLEDGG